MKISVTHYSDIFSTCHGSLAGMSIKQVDECSAVGVTVSINIVHNKNRFLYTFHIASISYLKL